MIPGPYSICYVFFPDDSDSASFRTLRYGYDTAMQAFSAIGKVAEDSGVPESDCAVVRGIDREEAEDFTS